MPVHCFYAVSIWISQYPTLFQKECQVKGCGSSVISYVQNCLQVWTGDGTVKNGFLAPLTVLQVWWVFFVGNGFMDGKELQNFIQELQQARKKAGLDLTPEMKAFVDQYGKSTDGKIGIVELAQVLPTEENFLLFFRCQQLKSSEDFMQTWRKYDSDHSGFIDSEELKSFLKDLLQKANKQIEDSKLSEYTEIMLRMFDANNDGKLELTELARLLPVQENFLIKFQGVKMCAKEFNNAFEMYDQDGNGYIDENELDALLKDLCEKNKKELDITNLATYKKSIMALSDGGKLYRAELALILCAEEN
uniref:Calbindin n=11 Tax=Passeriformes TaxID=9126 RepID=A0A8D2PCY8_ZOSLA